ncbi:MAG: hypothetical protein ACR2PL_12750 [Dehalococcoidia bacterium]
MDENASGTDDESPLFDPAAGVDVVLIAYDGDIGSATSFREVPEVLRQRVTRAGVIAANPHDGVALFCVRCDLLLNGTGTGGTCPICGDTDRSRVLYFMAELDEDERP